MINNNSTNFISPPLEGLGEVESMKKGFTTFLFLLLTLTVFAESGNYICGHFRRDSTVTVPALKNSGFTFGILFNVNVEANGDLTMDGALLCSDGKYTLASRHPNYIADVTALRSGWSSINRLEKCIGGWKNDSYFNIKALVNSQGTGENSILYKNFKALKEALPMIDAINNDDEHCYDVATASAFHIMLYDLGYKTTIAPFTNKTFWINFVSTINAARPGAVDRNYLQCYGGGAGNNPKDWNIGGLPVYGSRDIEANGYTHKQIVEVMTNWKNNAGIVGGFYWNYNWNRDLKAEAAPINEVFGGGEVVYWDKMQPHVTVFANDNFEGEGTNFQIGQFSTYGITVQNFNSFNLASIKVHEGFSVEVFEEDKQTGKSVVFSNNVAKDGLSELSSVASWKVVANGDPTFARKTLYFKNKQSGLYLSLEEDKSNEGITLVQKELNSANTQKWTFSHLQNGNYKITNQSTRKTIRLRDESVEEGTILEQGGSTQKDNQGFILVKNETDNTYRIVLEHSTKYMAVEGEKENVSGAKIIQTENGEAAGAQWILETEPSSGLSNLKISSENVIYPNPALDFLFIDKEIKNISQVIISDMQGSRIACENINSNRLDISGLVQGMYFLQIFIEGNENMIINRFIKE